MTLDRNLRILFAYDFGGRVADLAAFYGLSRSSVYRIIRREEDRRDWKRYRAIAEKGWNPDMQVQSLELSARARNALQLGGIMTVDQLMRSTPRQLKRLPNFGRKSLAEVEELLAINGFRLR
jgi:DNA-directed RNA polymerase alpha subunit